MPDPLAPVVQRPLDRRPGHVLFFAAVPPAEIREQIVQAWQSYGTNAPFRRNTLHLSIHAVAGMDDLDQVIIKRAGDAAASVRTAPFTLRFDRVKTFPNSSIDKPLVLATDRASGELNAVAAELHTACRARGLGASRLTKPTPHVTLAYGPGFPEIRPIEKPILWTIDEITLIDSVQGEGRHVVLGKWRLPNDREQQSFDF